MRPRPLHGTPRLLPLLPAAFALVLYLATLAPGVYWGDSAQLQLETAHPRAGAGARSYSAFTFTAALISRATGLPPAPSANLASALFGALAVALAFSFARRITGSALGGWVAAGSLAVSHAFWSAAVVAEVYTSTVLLLLLLLSTATSALRDPRRPAFLFGLVTGLSLLHHRMVPVVSFGVLLVLAVEWVRRGALRTGAGRTALGFAAGALPFLVLLARAAAGGAELGEFLAGGAGLSLPRLESLPGLLLYEARFLGLDLAGPQLVLAAGGLLLAARRRPGYAGPLLACAAAGLLLPLLFARVGDRSLFLFPALTAAGILAGVGAAALPGRFRSPLPALGLAAAVVLLPAGIYAGLARHGAAHPEAFFPGATPAHARAFLWPGKAGCREPERFGRSVLAALPSGAFLLTGWGDGEVIRYLREVEGLRPDLRVRRRRPRRGLAGAWRERGARPLFVSEYPGLPLRLPLPPGARLSEIIPRSLWQVLPAP